MRKSTKIYLILVTLTCLAFVIGQFNTSIGWLMGILLFSTLLKGKLIIDYFMGMDEYYRWSNFLTLWLGFVLLVIAGVYIGKSGFNI